MIEETDSIVFDKRHELLSGSAPEPKAIYDQAVRTLVSLDLSLTRVLAKDETVDDDWFALYRLFVGAQSWQATAWYMGQMIEERLGLETLQQSLESPALFWATYQQASELPDGSFEHEGTVPWYRATAPSFTEKNATWINHQLIRAP